MVVFCGILVVVFILFIYLLNTARGKDKKTSNPGAGIKYHTPVYVSIADKPDTIIQGMNKFVREVQQTESAGDKWRWVPMLIFFAGAGLVFIDALLTLLGYFSLVFSVGAFALWIAALILARKLRKSDSHDFSPRYYGLKEILRTLRDDLKPGSTFLGHLDLTGAMLDTKVARETQDAQNRITQYFSDNWLSLKAKLYDGNVLRVSAIHKTKRRKSYYKRSRISGKMKSKPAKLKGAEQELKVRIVVNPQVYDIRPNGEFTRGAVVGKYAVTDISAEGGMINILAKSPFDEVEQAHILQFLKSAYSLLQRKAV